MSKATKIMNTRNEYKNEMINELETLGYQVSVLDELIPITTKEETKEQPTIIINKGHIVEVQTIKEVVIDNTDEIIALENEIAFKDGQILGLNKQVKELEDKVAELQSALNAKKLTKVKPMKEELKEYKQQLEKEADVVKKPNKLDLLKRVKEAEQRKEENMNKNLFEEGMKAAEKEAQRKAEEKEAAKAQMPKYDFNYETITFNEDIDSSTKFGVRGTILLETKEYKFEATNNHHMPIVYGCFNEETRNMIKQIITNEVDSFNFMNELEGSAANYSHAHDAEFPLVVWRLTEDNGKVTYHGYTDKYILTWDKDKFAKHPGRKMIKNAFSNEPNMWKKVPNKQLADKFMAVCTNIWPEDFTNDDNDPEPTKAVKQITKEQQSTTKDEAIKVTRAVVYNGPIDNIGQPISASNDEEFNAEADDLDL